VPEKVRGFLETHLPRKFVDIVTGVNELPFLTLDIAEPGGVGHDSFQSSRNDCHGEIFVSNTPLSSAKYLAFDLPY
jgi:hypothetical protein